MKNLTFNNEEFVWVKDPLEDILDVIENRPTCRIDCANQYNCLRFKQQ